MNRVTPKGSLTAQPFPSPEEVIALADHAAGEPSHSKLSGETTMNFHARRIDSIPSFVTTPEVTRVGENLVFAAIAAHRSARAAFDVAQESHPEYKQRDDAEAELWDSLSATTPKTAAGLRAYLAYLNAFPMIDDQPDSLVAMRKAITQALERLHVADAPTPAVPTSAADDTIKALIAEHESMVDTVNSRVPESERDAAYARGPAPTSESGMNAASVRHFLLDIEPIAHDVKAYSEATRLLAEDTETSRNTLIKVAHLAEDASEKLVDVILGQFPPA